MKVRNAAIAGCLLLGLLAVSRPVLAWDNEKSHRKLTDKAVESSDRSTLELFVGRSLGIPDGLSGHASGKRLLDHVLDGSDYEDNWINGLRPRALSHFHNPTKELVDAGLSDVGYGVSAVAWAKGASMNEWDYKDFNLYYRQAAMSPLPEDREASAGKMFKTAGHLMHLVQDMFVPAHARNDLVGGHVGVRNVRGDVKGSPLEVLFRTYPIAAAPVPPSLIPSFATLTEYFDTGSYRDNGFVPSGGLEIGGAEYSNANFFSEHTVFSCDPATAPERKRFPHPCYGDVYYWTERREEWPLYERLMGRYYVGTRSAQEDTTVAHLARIPFFGGLTTQTNHPLFRLDDACRVEYLEKLVPKAIGYSAGLLEWLTRGAIDLAYDGVARQVTITNRSTEEMSGTFSLYYDRAGAVRAPVPGARWPMEVGPGSSAVAPSITLPADIGLDRTLTIVFEGRLGREDGVVAAVRKIGPYEFASEQTARYTELALPRLWEGTTAPDADGTFDRYHIITFGFRNGLSKNTLWRDTDFRIKIKATPELCGKLGLGAGQGWIYVNTNTFNNPGILEYFRIGLPDGKWAYVYDGTGVHADEGWGGVSNPLSYMDGAGKPEIGLIEYYQSLPSVENVASECSLDYYGDDAPGVNLSFSYPRDDVTGRNVPNCPNVESLIDQADAYFLQEFSQFSVAAVSLADYYAAAIRDANWSRYGFEVKVNRIVGYPSLKGDGLIYDGPVVFRKEFGSDQLIVQ